MASFVDFRAHGARRRLLAALFAIAILVPTAAIATSASLSLSLSVSSSSAPSLTVNTQDTTGATLTGYFVQLYLNGLPISSGYTPATFTLVSGATYVVESDGYGSCVFDHWLDTGSTNNQRSVSITSDASLTSVLNCGSSSTTTTTTTSTSSATSMGITVYAHRVPASYWDPCFATSCTNTMASCNTTCTGPGTTMYFALYDSAGNFISGGFADENGFTFTGLNPSATYYVYPDDCNMCHGSLHDVVFQYWGDGSTTRPLAATVGQSLDAWYSCTNSCA